MTEQLAPQKLPALDSAAVLARWVLGALFVYMGWNKASHPDFFLKMVHEYGVITSSLLLNTVAATLPWFEIFCGLLLIAGIAVRGSALVILGMLVPFTILVLRRALVIAGTQGLAFCAVKFDCGCGTGEVWICGKMIENCLLITISAWLVAGWGRRWAIRYQLAGSKPQGGATPVPD